MEHRLEVAPVRQRRRHELLAVDASRVVGYRASCSCGARGRVRATVAAARAELTGHERPAPA